MLTLGNGRLWRALPILCAGLLLLASGPAPAAVTQAVPARHRAAPSAADLAIQLEALLGQHSVLAADLMRSRIRGDDDFVQAANAALGKNTSAMTTLVGQLFGQAAADKFGPMWSEHIVGLFTYAGAIAAQDKAALEEARKELVEYEEDLGDFFAGASQGRLSRAAARAAVVQHVGHLTGQADAYAAKNYALADDLYRMGYQHTYDLGLTLAKSLLPAKDVATLGQPLWRLRSQLGKLLAEHAALVEDLTRAAVTGSPDFDSSGQMINGNTADLAAAMDTLFGPAAAKQFQSLWADHVEQLVAYSSATAAADKAKQDQARTEMAGIEQRMGTFLAGATSKHISAADLTAAVQKHDMMLMKHADAYAAKDYATAHDVAYDTYQDMFGLATQLADAFGVTVAARLPRGGAQTGYGGMAAVVESR
ncbi:hypothetical protein ACQP2F_07630 [Actinoplanes sp. CA-030573]|uniref:hypothetical protein n=1 Tax=Actinoplanes sp. CA-030573 TaxID=3239898 RepID=UPI003D8F006F